MLGFGMESTAISLIVDVDFCIRDNGIWGYFVSVRRVCVAVEHKPAMDYYIPFGRVGFVYDFGFIWVKDQHCWNDPVVMLLVMMKYDGFMETRLILDPVLMYT